MRGRFESGEDIVALRRFVGLTQADFARAIEISVHTLRNWEQGRRRPEGPAIALLRIAARHPDCSSSRGSVQASNPRVGVSIRGCEAPEHAVPRSGRSNPSRRAPRGCR